MTCATWSRVFCSFGCFCVKSVERPPALKTRPEAVEQMFFAATLSECLWGRLIETFQSPLAATKLDVPRVNQNWNRTDTCKERHDTPRREPAKTGLPRGLRGRTKTELATDLQRPGVPWLENPRKLIHWGPLGKQGRYELHWASSTELNSVLHP